MNIRTSKNLKILTAGFTLVELLVVIGMIAIISAIATPSFIQWRENLQYKQAADGILAALRTAKSNAVTHNIQNRFECNTTGNRYRITQGNRSYNSTTWATINQDWASVPNGVILKTGDCTSNSDLNIQFNPNGTVTTGTNGTICVKDSSSEKYQIVVATSGRIEVKK
jgi:prepilin-type N-terminal cleavage/methylation domain-containing protein